MKAGGRAGAAALLASFAVLGAAVAAPVDRTDGARTLRVCVEGARDERCDFHKLADAIDAARSGDTVLLAPGIYREAVLVTTPHLTIKGEPGAHLQGAAIEGKAALVVRADDVTIDGIECSGIQVADNNGACVRIEGRDLVIRNAYFHDNQEGVLGGTGGTVTIEHTRFERNGYNGGYAHSVYIAAIDNFIFRHNQVLSTKDEGQGVKSRAKRTVIENNVIAGLEARDSRAIDVPNGGEVIIRNNVLQKGPNSSNSQMIELGLEGNLHPGGSAIIENNILLFDRDLPRLVRIIEKVIDITSKPGTAVANKMKGEVVIRNNVLQKGPNSSNSQMIELGLEGNLHPGGSAIIENNILLFDQDLPHLVRIIEKVIDIASKPGTAVANEMKGEVMLRHNVIVGAGQLDSGEEVTKRDNALYRSRAEAGLPDAPHLPPVPSPANAQRR